MNELNVRVENVNGILVTTSNRVAEELEVEHKNLLRKIDDYILKFGSSNLSHEFYIESTFENRGKNYKNYLITEKGIAQLIGGYSSAVPKAFDLNVAYINEFERMKQELTKPKLPQTFAEALKLAYEQQLIIEQQAPKVEYHDNVLRSRGLLTVTEIAKDLGMSAIKLNKILHELGFQYKKNKSWVLYSKYEHLVPQYFDYHISEYGQVLKIKELGRKFIINLLKDNNII